MSSQTPYQDLRQGEYFQIGRRLYQTSNVYDNRLTAQIVFPVQTRTVVETISKTAYELTANEPTDGIIAKYDAA